MAEVKVFYYAKSSCCADVSSRSCKPGYTKKFPNIVDGFCPKEFNFYCFKRTQKSGAITVTPNGQVSIATSGFTSPSSKKVTLKCGANVSNPVTYTLCDIKPLLTRPAIKFYASTTISPDQVYSGITK